MSGKVAALNGYELIRRLKNLFGCHLLLLAKRGAATQAIFTLLALVAVQAEAQTTAAGVMDGTFNVTSSGAATYSIPIKIPPPLGGMAPKISLEYNSQVGNGIAGVGWSIGGLSAIMRCPKTITTDGARGGINYDSGDRYCLENKRLVLSQGPAYHAAGNYYRTELDNFSRIVSNGSTAGAADSFTVETKDGLILEYGGTADSKIEVQGSSAIRAWALNKVSDRKGNYYTIEYYEDGPNPQFYPLRIQYTGTAVGGPKNAVVFDYEARPDDAVEYQAGGVIRTVNRLKEISTLVNGVLNQKYLLTYGDNITQLHPSRLTKVQQCDPGDNCLPSTIFTWESGGTWGFSGEGSGVWSGVAATPITAFLGDFNGDGKADQASYINVGLWNICLSTGSGFNCSVWAGHLGNVQNNFPGDYNGDGLTDIMAYTGTPGVWQVCLSTGTSFNCQNRNGHAGGPANNVTGDFNGDGKTDMAGYWGSNGVWTVCLATDGDFNCGLWNGPFVGKPNNIIADFNGDGLDDMAADVGLGNWVVCLSTGTNFNCSNWAGHTGGYVNNVVGDFNGDGLSDIAGYTGNGALWDVCLSTGKGFSCNYWTGNTAGAQQSFVADINGDGKSDLIRFNDNGAEWKVCFANGVDFECGIYLGHSGGYLNNLMGDYNGDGKVDLSGYTGSGVGWHVVLSSGGERERIIAISTPYVDNAFSIDYKRITDNSVYTKDSGGNVAALPIVDSQYAFPVVSTVTRATGSGSFATQYLYGGLKQDPAGGRGFLGFRWTSEKNLTSGVETYTEYAQDWPFTSMIKRMEVRLAGGGFNGILKRTTNQLSQGSGSTDYSKFSYLNQSTEESWDLDGSGFPTVISSYEYGESPQYGDVTKISVTSGNVTKTTTQEYFPRSAFDANGWIIGRMKSATVTSTKQ